MLDDVQNGDRNSTYSALRKLGVRPSDSGSNTFRLPAHVDRDLTPVESAELIADHFASISQEYASINANEFPPNMREALNHPDMSVVPKLQEYEVYSKMCKAKKPNSTIPGDLPIRIAQEFSCELSNPVTAIYNSILKTFQYPRQWVIEH